MIFCLIPSFAETLLINLTEDSNVNNNYKLRNQNI